MSGIKEAGLGQFSKNRAKLIKIARILTSPGQDAGLIMLVEKEPELVRFGLRLDIAQGRIILE